MAADLAHSPAVATQLALDEVSLAQGQAQMNSNNAFAAIVIPPGFTASLLSAYGLAAPLATAPAGPPTAQLLTNPRAGSVGIPARHRRGAARPSSGVAGRRARALSE